MLLQGFVNNFAGLLATRFLLGVCEAGAFPVIMGNIFKSDNRDAFICYLCGTNAMRHKKDSHSFSHRRLLRGLLEDFWLGLLERWRDFVITVVGDGVIPFHITFSNF